MRATTHHCEKPQCTKPAGPSGYCYIHSRGARNSFFTTWKRQQAMKGAAK